METFATPANFLSETAARLLVERVFILEKRDRRSLERASEPHLDRAKGGLGTPRGEKETRPLEKEEPGRGRRGGGLKTERQGDRGGRVVEFNGCSFFWVIYYRREFERTRAF